MKKFTFAISLIVLASLILSACGAPAPEPTEAPVVATEAPTQIVRQDNQNIGSRCAQNRPGQEPRDDQQEKHPAADGDAAPTAGQLELLARLDPHGLRAAALGA